MLAGSNKCHRSPQRSSLHLLAASRFPSMLPAPACRASSPHVLWPLATSYSTRSAHKPPRPQTSLPLAAGLRIKNKTTGCQRDKVLEDKDKSMLLHIWSKMSCSGILPEFSICSGIEELIYLLRGAPRGRPGRGAARGPSRPPAGSSATTS